MQRQLQRPYYILLLPLFFVWHGFVENFNYVPVADALLLLSLYIAAFILLTGLSWLLLKNITKAALAAFYLLAFHFFFGAIHDFIKSLAPGSFLSKYLFVITAAILLFIVWLVWLKKSNKSFYQLNSYLNLLLLVLVLIDAASLAVKASRLNKHATQLPAGFITCDTCRKPDIYFILADEYVGSTTLKEQFNFDNSNFTNQLSQRGFHTIPYSQSNYNFTPFSVASTLDMNYLPANSGFMGSTSDLALCYQTIAGNKLLKFLQQQGYDFYNYSIFDFKGQPARIQSGFLPAKTRLITSQTFLSRFDRDLRFNLVTRFQSQAELKRLTYGYLHNNESSYTATIATASKPTVQPKFVFTHLHMPHYPYYFDAEGKEQPFETLTEGNQRNKQRYISYLQYSNKKYLSLVDTITKLSAQPPIIILLSDHGFRHFSGRVDSKYLYLNHASILLPSKTYAAFTDRLTNVNFFRALLNTSFGQQLPMLKDTTIYIRE